jgi:hypothetical protein
MSVRTRLVSASIALLIGVGVLGVGGGAMAAPGDPGGRRFRSGAPGAGDAYFPFAGNGGYDVRHCDLDITYTPPAPDPAPLVGQLRGVATIDLVASRTWTASTSTCGAWTSERSQSTGGGSAR